MQILRSWCQSVLNKRILVWKTTTTTKFELGSLAFLVALWSICLSQPAPLHWVSPKGRHELGGKLLRLFTSYRSLGECRVSCAKVTNINILSMLGRLNRLTVRKGPPSALQRSYLGFCERRRPWFQWMVSQTWLSAFSRWNFPLALLSHCIDDTFLNIHLLSK